MSQLTARLLAIALIASLLVRGDVAGQPGPANGNGNGAAAAAAPAPPPDNEETPLLAEPKTPDELFAAAVLMQKLARPKLARDYLQRFVELNPSDDFILGLRDVEGPAIFLRLANNPDLNPYAAQILDRINRLMRERASDPKRIDALIDDLTGPSDRADVALVSLSNAGPVVVPRILLQVGDPTRKDRRDILVHALGRMGTPFISALLGALDSPNETVQSGAFEALALIGSREAVPFLWHPAFSPDEPRGVQASARAALAQLFNVSVERVSSPRPNVAKELKRLALEYFRGQHNWPETDDHKVAVWSWNPQANTVAESRLSPKAASYLVGARFAKQALSFSEEDAEAQRLFLALSLAGESERAGRDQRLPTGLGTVHDLALTAGRNVMLDVLSLGLECKNTDSVLVALQVLKQIGSRHQLFAQEGHRSPLIAAMDYPDPRVQFLAATTIVQLDPERPFPGSEKVVAILTRALNSGSTGRTVVIDADMKRGNDIAALLEQIGVAAEAVPTGRDGFLAATRTNDVSLILVQTNAIRWPLTETVANLRADARTANIPIVIYGPEAVRSKVQALADRNSGVTYIIEPTSLEGLESRIQPVLANVKAIDMSSAERAEQSAAAVDWLAQIASSRRTDVFNIAPAEASLIDSLVNSQLAQRALLALSSIPTKNVQVRFFELAISAQHAAEEREAAAAYLATHIQRHGLLLSREQVVALKTAWQASTDPSVASALAAAVGSLQPDPRKVGSRLKSFPAPATLPVRP